MFSGRMLRFSDMPLAAFALSVRSNRGSSQISRVMFSRPYIDAYDPADMTKRIQAITVVTQLGTRQRGALGAQVLSEFVVTVTRKITPSLTQEEAEQRLTNYMRSWRVVDLTTRIVVEAVRGVQQHQLAYCDSLILATAKLSGIPTVLNEDFSHGWLIEGVRSLNPFASTFDLMPLGLSISPEEGGLHRN
jgi:predicted nucleic acid-binding protein